MKSVSASEKSEPVPSRPIAKVYTIATTAYRMVMPPCAGGPRNGTSVSPADCSLLSDDDQNTASTGEVVVAVIENRAMEVRVPAAVGSCTLELSHTFTC